MKLGRPLGAAIAGIISIVSAGTFRKWVAASRRRTRTIKRKSPGRPRTAEDIRQIIVRFGRETDRGQTRIHGELKKVGVQISRTTVGNILREAGIPTAPDRSESPWHQFIARHAKTLWACDFMTKRVWTPRGLVDAFILVFIHLGTRRVHVSQGTTRPDAKWVKEQAEIFATQTGAGRTGAILIHDRDTKLGKAFDGSLKRAGVTPHPLPFRSPNMNAHVERVIQTIQHECLDRFVVLGTGHLDYLVSEFISYYNQKRPHSAIEFRAPVGLPDTGRVRDGPVRCESRLGGVIRHYYRDAA